MKTVSINIKSCFNCPRRQPTSLAGFNSTDYLDECTEARPARLIQRPDEEGDFPAWCPLPDAPKETL